MEHGREYYVSVIRVFDYIAEGNRDVSFEKGLELAGNYWPAVYRLFDGAGAVRVFSDGSIHVTQPQWLNPIYADCRYFAARIEKEDNARNVDLKYKIKGILDGGISLIISSLVFLLSLWTVIRQAGIF